MDQNEKSKLQGTWFSEIAFTLDETEPWSLAQMQQKLPHYIIQ